MTHPISHWVSSHPGCVRPTNQDAYLCRPDIGLFAVADGVGGRAGGGFASGEVMRLLDTMPRDLAAPARLSAVRARLEDAHGRLLAEAASRDTEPAATTIVVLLLHDGHAACLWAGDSRAYLLRHGTMHQLTSDHSLVGEMLRAGELTEAEAEHHPHSNVITRAIGVGAVGPLLDKAIGLTEPGDRFLLCSDGLTRAVAAAELIALAGGENPADALIEAAVLGGARDNVTALVLDRHAGE